ncbi:MAG: nucleotidyltransferase substrate binding protein, partial [Dehalococcoidales bacterium]
GVLSQTTQSQKKFADFLSRVIDSELASLAEIRVFNTICDATGKRQAAALRLASEVDWMLVIRGRDSANENGDLWLDMLGKRNLMAHTYDETKAQLALDLIVTKYYTQLEELYQWLKNKLNEE